MADTKSSPDKFSEGYARQCDEADPLRHLRDEFTIPSQADLKSKTLADPSKPGESEESTYLCGNSLGLRPKRVAQYVDAQLKTWATKGVFGHFKSLEGSCLPPWLQMDEDVTHQTAKIVGASPSEVAVMQTLTVNLHLLMASFYRPTAQRYKVIIEAKAFPSDHYLVESQIRHHDLDPATAMVTIDPPSDTHPLLTTAHILSVIDAHAAETALLLLPGVQFYTGQFFDIKAITAHAQSKGLVVGWDLAHVAGNLPVQLHDWNVDFAAWCNYKYMNCGPGAIGGLFVHSRHTDVANEGSSSSKDAGATPSYRPRLAGWWGSSKEARFAMTNEFIPIAGAGGFQLSNPSALDMSAVLASLSVFGMTDMQSLRQKSLKVTAYLEQLLDHSAEGGAWGSGRAPWTIITPRKPEERGAQLSVKLDAGMLDAVMHHLEEHGVVVDERRPDVVRIAPAPLYNSFHDAWRFVDVFTEACRLAVANNTADGAKKTNGTS